MDEKIFAYRINEELFCPECYEKFDQNLPKDSGFKITGKPLTREEIEIYACISCKKTRGGKGLDGLRDMIEDCSCKISFLEDFFSQPRRTDEFFSERGKTGLCIFLRELYDDLDFVVNEMSQMQREGIIKEVS